MKTWENSKRCEEMPPKILSKTDSSRKKWWARSQTILWLGKFLYGHKRNCPSRKGIIILKAPRSLAPLLLFSLDANIRPALFLNQQAQGQACECLSLRQESEVVLLITCSFTCILALTLLWKSCGRNDQLHPVGSCPQLGRQREGQQPCFFFFKDNTWSCCGCSEMWPLVYGFLSLFTPGAVALPHFHRCSYTALARAQEQQRQGMNLSCCKENSNNKRVWINVPACYFW